MQQQHFPTELSELMNRVGDLSKALMFTHLGWNQRIRDDDSYYWQSRCFKPLSNTYTPKNKSDSEPNTEQKGLERLQKLNNSLSIHTQMHVEAIGWPNSAHGVVEITNSHTKSIEWISGTMIASHLVLTTSSDLYKSSYTSIQFRPVMHNAGFWPFPSSFNVIKVFSEDSETSDYAFVMLDYPIGLQTGFFGISVGNEELKDQEVTTVTFESNEGDLEGDRKYKLDLNTTKIKEIDKEAGLVYFYDDPLNSVADQSCGIVFVKEGSDYYVIGVQNQKSQKKDNLSGNSISGARMFKKDDTKLFDWVRGANKLRLLLVENAWEADRNSDEETINNIEEDVIKENLWNCLTILDLKERKVGPEGAVGLGRNHSWLNLHTLNLSENTIGDKGAAGLGKNHSWLNLDNLNLWGNNIGDKGAAELGKNLSWLNLHNLDLSRNDIGSKGATGLGKNHSWLSIHTLDLSHNSIGNKGAAELGRNRSWLSLRILDISYNSIGPEGASGLAKNRSWLNLHSLDLSFNDIGEKGAVRLAKNRSWLNLHTLKLPWNEIGDKGAAALRKNHWWLKLEDLYIRDPEGDDNL